MRVIDHCQIECNTELAPLSKTEAFRTSIVELAKEKLGDEPATLLAFALDGLIWGRLDSAELTIANDVGANHSPQLLPTTLQELRLFNQSAELFIWRAGDGFRMRTIYDLPGDSQPYFDEKQILWGDATQETADPNFTTMSDGVQGLHHTVPIKLAVDSAEGRPLRLTLRHYLAEDEPFARVKTSRLVNLFSIKRISDE